MTASKSNSEGQLPRGEIEVASKFLTDAIGWDIDIGLEASRHSVWLTAFCTAGLAFLATQASDWLLRPSALVTIVFAMSSGALLAGGVIGGLTKRRLRRGIALKREQQAFVARQLVNLLAFPQDPVNFRELDDVVRNVLNLKYLDPRQQVEYRQVTRRDELDQSENYLIPLQEWLVLVGFMLLFLCSVVAAQETALAGLQ
jgi:hypothetical protein